MIIVTLLLLSGLAEAAPPRRTTHEVGATLADVTMAGSSWRELYRHQLEPGKWNIIDIALVGTAICDAVGIDPKSLRGLTMAEHLKRVCPPEGHALTYHQRVVLMRPDGRREWLFVGAPPTVTKTNGDWDVAALPDKDVFVVRVRGDSHSTIRWEIVALASTIHKKDDSQPKGTAP